MTAAPTTAPTASGRRVRVGSVVLFCLLSFGLAWVVAAPMWLSGQGLDLSYGRPLIGAMMFTPAIAAFVVLRLVDRAPGIARTTGLLPLRPLKPLLGYCAVGLVLPMLVIFGGIFVAALAGAYPADLTDFSGFRALAGPLGLVDADGTGVPFAGLALFAAVQGLGLLLGLPMMLGEEWGWRGYLLPALLPMGTWPALLLHGVIWGLWHAPVILLGYNFGHPDLTGLGYMAVLCTVFGLLLGWLRTASDSIWPAVVAHGAFNSSSVLFILFSDADSGLGTNDSVPPAIWLAVGAVAITLFALACLSPRIRRAIPAPGR